MKPFMSHRKGGDGREMKVGEREESTDSGGRVVEMDKGERESKTEGVALIIASYGAVTIFHSNTLWSCCFFVFNCRFPELKTEERASLKGMVCLFD